MTKPLAVPDSAFDLASFRIAYEPDPFELAHLPPDVRQLLVRLAIAASEGDTSALRQAERAVEKHPDVPQFKNYLSLLYEKAGLREKADVVVEQTVARHPDYFFARVNKLNQLLLRGELEDAQAFLAQVGGYDLHDWYPGRTDFNVVEMRAFFRTLAVYFAAFNDTATARRYLRAFRSLEVDRETYEHLKKELNRFQLLGSLRQINEAASEEQTLEGQFEADDEQTDQPPVLHHPAVSALYDYGLNLPASVREQILALPPDTLRADLEAVALDAVNRYRWFSEQREEWVEEEQTFPIHALLLLRERADARSLPVVLKLLRQGAEFLQYWFADELEEVFVPTLRALGDGQWPTLEAFLREPGQYWMSRYCVLTAIVETARYEPARQPEARERVGDLLRFFYENRADPSLLDTNVMAELAAAVAALKATDVLPLVERCFAEGLASESIYGDYPEIVALLEGTEPDYRPDPGPPTTAPEFYGERARAATSYESTESAMPPAPDEETGEGDLSDLDIEALLGEMETSNAFDLDDDDAFFARLRKPTPPAVPALGRNDKVSVRYPDGRVLTDVKYKKVEDDLKRGKCLLIS